VPTIYKTVCRLVQPVQSVEGGLEGVQNNEYSPVKWERRSGVEAMVGTFQKKESSLDPK